MVGVLFPVSLFQIENPGRPSGTWIACGLNPALKCRAIVIASLRDCQHANYPKSSTHPTFARTGSKKVISTTKDGVSLTKEKVSLGMEMFSLVVEKYF